VTRVATVTLLVAVGCVDPLTHGATNAPEWDVKNIKGYAETVAGLPPETLLAWDLRVEGGVARWRDCTAIEACRDVEHERPASELLAVEYVGHAGVGDGGEIDVLKLSFPPRPKYVVPTCKRR
jgi:hypothetical protein